MSAKCELFTRLEYLYTATQLPQMVDNGIAMSEHNGVAILLRKGLGIVAFNMLEDYVKNKCEEALSDLSSSNPSFLDLPDFLQEAATLGALKALAFRARLLKNEGLDWKLLIQDESAKISSTGSVTYNLSKFSLVNTGSNISTDEIAELLKAFGIARGWDNMKKVSDAIGGGIVDLRQAYNNAAIRRHNSAHSASFNYDYSFIANLKSEILAISASLDILLTARCRQVDFDSTKKIDTHDLNSALKYIFLEPSGSVYKQTRGIGGRSSKNWATLQEAIDYLQPNLKNNHDFLIVLSPSLRIENWFV